MALSHFAKEGAVFKDGIFSSGLPSIFMPKHEKLWDYIETKIKSFGNNVALQEYPSREEHTFASLITLVSKIKKSLKKVHIKEDSLVAVLGDENFKMLASILAINSANAIYCPKQEIFEKEKAKEYFSDLNVDFLVVLTEDLKDFAFPIGASIVYVDKDAESFLIKDGTPSKEHDSVKREKLEKNKTAALYRTSGTTGNPKQIMITNSNYIAMLKMLENTSLKDFGKDDVVLTSFAISKSPSILIYFFSLISGMKLICLPKFSIDSFLKCLVEIKISILWIQPWIFSKIAFSDTVPSEALKTIKCIQSGGCSVNEKAVDLFAKKFPWIKSICEGYGMSETTNFIAINPNKGWKVGSVGILLPNVQCKIVSEGQDQALAHNEIGMICVKGPNLTAGFANKEDSFNKLIDKDGFYETGDVGYFDKDGFLHLINRMNDVIFYRSQHVYPSKIEQMLKSNEDVDDALVMGIKSLEDTEIPKAFVKARKRSEHFRDQLIEMINEMSDPYHLRGGLDFVDDIPLSMFGKRMRRRLMQ